MALYTPPIGKCTECKEYIGKPRTGEVEKNNTGFGEEFETEYYCPVCSDTTAWRRLHYENLISEIGETPDVKISEELEPRVRSSAVEESEYIVWQPDYRED